MNVKIPKAITPILLGVLAIVIWGHNSYRFITGVSAEEDTTVSGHDLGVEWSWDSQDSSATETQWVFDPQYRDPFQSWLLPVPKAPEPAKNRKPERRSGRQSLIPAEQPQIKLVGIIQDERGTLAVVEDNANMTWFALPGDTVSQSMITEVKSTSIRYRYKGKEFTLGLE
jgi:hypothetical protein